MGAGKSTVLSPALTVMLADGRSMVTQVMPASLLDMSRRVTRAVLSAPFLRRMVLTFHFERFSLPSLRSFSRPVTNDRLKIESSSTSSTLLGPFSLLGASGGHPYIGSGYDVSAAHAEEGFGFEERLDGSWRVDDGAADDDVVDGFGGLAAAAG